MTKYDSQLLAALDDGRWHRVDELPAPPSFGALGIEAWIRLLRVEGHPIDERAMDSAVTYRLGA